ncbi:MAG: Orotate phosphoribosyltransferase [Candidatus Nomurabacteria bacterium GW2011_GWF2_35_66]|uniref:Orotate phosphoribosyltransferase n=1 Tax=Candidatus Nomurabacteria bacterium GW2011_GWE1_35_16 TaxID=1618761 RepID=A0A0G0EH20_9BACT|nr:MAG: Orotate phosphoribosyltransferase [Candidatus Nomurabacteria bacterium GW2011_GWF1_34_20]KKP63370.1 MAG: Orotate phosphoribosyltransferase [Candidatus Nomurabacteria bacterium GW2011_GWE2_34_25]KKP66562.1 MAG: Orotate phosphoribosyltransferase [Candidatus Nomurabacteria bacterium GW2011_GWE1_35_16]KKP83608.1 MAG: Orotate phosphoribosyltransferase [Candidatus Nomurabacteria bacterium GW2011_GWF2_35_66]HAE36868.1 hypothetical protein [Candidatus Nomurabacteria bacterium]
MKKKPALVFEFWLAMKIARTMLFIKATTFKKLTEDPYKWACGMLMRIYNDNRMMLGNFKHRMRITKGFVNLIWKNKINPDFIIGTSTSGIAPATAVAKALSKELLIHQKDEYYAYEIELCDKEIVSILNDQEFDVVITNVASIPYGIQYANKFRKPFAYVRNETKDHGKKMLIEGIVKPGMKFIFLYSSEENEDSRNSISILKNEFRLQLSGSYFTGYMHRKMDSYQLVGLKAVVIEDLFSTGGSSAFEVYKARQAGMICNYCFSIFSYGFDCLKKQFSGEINISNKEVRLAEVCEIDSLLPFWVLNGEIQRLHFYPHKTIKAMIDEINGFDKRYKSFLAEKEMS